MSQNDAETRKSGAEDGTENELVLVPYIEIAPNQYAPMPGDAIIVHRQSSVLSSFGKPAMDAAKCTDSPTADFSPVNRQNEAYRH